jgi:hypothetical protein
MKGPLKSFLGALSIATFFGWPHTEIILQLSLGLYFCMALNALPLLLLAGKQRFVARDHWLGPSFYPVQEAPNFSFCFYLLGPLLNIGTGLFAMNAFTALYPYTMLPLFWGLFRCLPIEPLEGWYLLRALLKPFLGYWEKKTSYFLAGSFFSLLCFYGLFNFSSYIYWLSLLALGAAFYCFQNFWHFRKMGPADEDPHLLELYHQAISLFRENASQQADKKLLQIIESGVEGAISDQARVIYAKGLLEQANPHRALEIVTPCVRRQPAGIIEVLHLIAYQCSDFESVRKLAQKAWRETSDSSVAMMNAISCARLYGQQASQRLLEETLGWLSAAARMGYFPWNVLEGPDFNAIKNEPPFQDFKSRMQKEKLKKPQSIT